MARKGLKSINFRSLTDDLASEEALLILRAIEVGKSERMKKDERDPTVSLYNISLGWLTYGKDRMRELLQQALIAVLKNLRLKVGGSLKNDKG